MSDARGDEIPYGAWWMTPDEEAELKRLREQNQRDRDAFCRDIWERDERIRKLVHGTAP